MHQIKFLLIQLVCCLFLFLLLEKLGKGVYPEDLSKEEFHQILAKMLNEGKIEEVKKILTQRSVVERNGNELVGIDYIDKFKEDFAKMADEILL